ncbi:MAG: hypothetical protein ACPL07_01135, partial [Candidatus Bathyarchaeia archaeon]
MALSAGSIIWSSIYIITSMIVFGLSLNILLRQRRSVLHQQFFIYGLLVSLHLFTNFLKLIVPDADLSLKLFRLSNSLYIISIGLLAYFVYEIRVYSKTETRSEKKGESYLILIPSVFVVTISSLISYKAKLSDFGWMFIPYPSLTIEGLITFFYLFGYSTFIGIILYNYIKTTKAPWLKKKYSLMLFSFVLFQIIGVVFFNALMILFENIPPTMGPFYFLSFILISYSFVIGPPKETVLTSMSNPLTDSYQKFLNKLLDVAPPD